MMARLLLILALILQPAALGAVLSGWSACRGEQAVSAACHAASQIKCCCCGLNDARATSTRCPCVEAPQAPTTPARPLPSAPTAAPTPHLALIGVANASDLPATFRSPSWRHAMHSPARSAHQARAILCIWLT